MTGLILHKRLFWTAGVGQDVLPWCWERFFPQSLVSIDHLSISIGILCRMKREMLIIKIKTMMSNQFQVGQAMLTDRAIAIAMELNNLMLEFTFLLDWPSELMCCVHAFNGHKHKQEYKSCTLWIQEYLKSFCGYECVELTWWISAAEEGGEESCRDWTQLHWGLPAVVMKICYDCCLRWIAAYYCKAR